MKTTDLFFYLSFPILVLGVTFLFTNRYIVGIIFVITGLIFYIISNKLEKKEEQKELKDYEGENERRRK